MPKQRLEALERLNPNSPGIAGADIVGSGKAALVDGNRDTVKTVYIGQRLPDVNIGKALREQDDITVNAAGIVLDGNADPIAILNSGLQEQFPGNIGP